MIVANRPAIYLALETTSKPFAWFKKLIYAVRFRSLSKMTGLEIGVFVLLVVAFAMSISALLLWLYGPDDMRMRLGLSRS